jgi:hypothetical protein
MLKWVADNKIERIEKASSVKSNSIQELTSLMEKLDIVSKHCEDH